MIRICFVVQTEPFNRKRLLSAWSVSIRRLTKVVWNIVLIAVFFFPFSFSLLSVFVYIRLHHLVQLQPKLLFLSVPGLLNYPGNWERRRGSVSHSHCGHVSNLIRMCVVDGTTRQLNAISDCLIYGEIKNPRRPHQEKKHSVCSTSASTLWK